jgi:RND family efflux transporter MFP subunit
VKSLTNWVLVLFLIAIAAGAGFWLGHRSGGGEKDESDTAGKEGAEPKPVANVSVVPIRKAAISDDIVAYGEIVAPTSEVQVVSVPFESRVVKTMVAPGQPVTAGQTLIEVEPSAATMLALQDARNALEASKRDYELVQQRFGQKLATNSELFAAQNTLKSAQAHLQSLQKAGADGRRQLKAEAPGIASKIDVQAGQVVPIGGPLVEVASQSQIEAKLGVEPNDTGALSVGQDVQLKPVENPGAEPVTGKIRLVGRLVDPTSRLIDVMVSLPPDSKLLLDSFVAGKLARASAEGLLVPREAVLPSEDEGYELFTIKNNHAAKHSVKLGVENNQQVQVIADDLKEGDLAVVLGNYELEDGMQVNAQPAATEPATTESATTAPATSEAAATEPSSAPATQTGGPR